MSERAIADMTHAEICAALGVAPRHAAPWWLPYAARATRISIQIEGSLGINWGGSMRCAQCDFAVDMKPGPGTNHPEPEALIRCPKCGFDGAAPPQSETEERSE